MAKISVVINTLNEEKNIEKAIISVKWADEIVIMDDGSTDNTLEIIGRVKSLESRVKVFKHKSQGYVEPARNFAISKASGDWILILDADEEIPDTLVERLKNIADKMRKIDFVEIPRMNIIFGKWMKASMWWPDYHVRFFKKGSVQWNETIHSKPKTSGSGIKLEPDEKWSITHNNYENVAQFIERLNRYTSVQAKELEASGVRFSWKDLMKKPLGEFLSRFFANKGYEDGLHGLVLSILQAFSFVVVNVKLWEMEKFSQQDLDFKDLKDTKNLMGDEISYWFKYGNLSKNSFKRFIQKVRNKII